MMKASDWATWIGTAVIVVLMVLALVGCGGDGKDGAPGPQGPAGADGRDGQDGESYVSYTNATSGNITTIAVDAGDHSPVTININDASGAGAQAGTRENPPAPVEAVAEEDEEGSAAP
jgi:hypothetical protein